MPDVVYVVKPGEVNRELVFSMRSLVNLPHGRVWIAGHKPQWVSAEVGHIAVGPQIDKYRSSTANILAACAHPEVSDRFYYFNDDFFVVKPLPRLPVLHRGPVEEIPGYSDAGAFGIYSRGMRETARLVRDLGIADVTSYELHVPMAVDKRKMLEVLGLPLKMRRPIGCIHKRTLYGNLAGVGGKRHEDVKVYSASGRWRDEWAFISTTDHSFAHAPVGRHLRAMFPDPSPYER